MKTEKEIKLIAQLLDLKEEIALTYENNRHI